MILLYVLVKSTLSSSEDYCCQNIFYMNIWKIQNIKFLLKLRYIHILQKIFRLIKY